MVARRIKKSTQRIANVTTDRPALTGFKNRFDDEVKMMKYFDQNMSAPSVIPGNKKKLTYAEAAEKAAKIGNILCFIQSVLSTLPAYVDNLEELTKDKSQYDSKLRNVIDNIIDLGSFIRVKVHGSNSVLNGLATDKNRHLAIVMDNTEIAYDMLSIALDCDTEGNPTEGKEVLVRMPLSLLNSLSINSKVWTANNVRVYGYPETQKENKQ